MRRGARLLRPWPGQGVPCPAQHCALWQARRRHRAQARHVLHRRAHDQSGRLWRESAERRLDRGNPRSFAVGAVRTFGGRDRDRRGDFHPVAQGPAQAALSLSHSVDEANAPFTPSRAASSETGNEGHRERLRARFLKGGADAMPDYELLELTLFAALPRRDTKPLAKALLARFRSFAEVIAAPRARLMEVKGVGEGVANHLKIVEAAAQRLAKTSVIGRPA